MINKIVILLSLGLFLVSCGEQPFFDDVHSFENRTWNQTETASFEFDVEDISKPYSLGLNLRTTTDYAYSNLWVYLSLTAPDGVTSKTAYRINITNPDGSWIGNKSGTIVESKLIFSAAKFPLKGKYTYALAQAVNQQEVDNILDIGLTVDEEKK